MKSPSSGVSRRTVLAAATAATVAGAARARTRRPPNVVFIMADDLGAFDLSCYGRPDYRTPHIDRLAREGMKFTRAYANSNTCTPTRTALFSGRYQNRLEIGTGAGGGYAGDKIGYPPELPSLASTMKGAGYRTALFGKWNLGMQPRFGPDKSGYDESLSFPGGAMDYWTHDLNESGGKARIPQLEDNGRPVDLEGYATDLFTARTVDFIQRNKSRPFFVSVHYNAPHWPWQTRTDRGGPRESDFHYEGGSPAIYAEMVRAMDDGVGQILATLDRLKLARDTIVVFTSDNGGERFSYMWPLRGGKGDMYEGGIRVPLLVRWPGRVKGGAQSDQVTLSMDWLPTLAAAAGARPDKAYPSDGIDLSPQLSGGLSVARTVFFWVGEQKAALRHPWKYIRIDTREYLYNLTDDPMEQANLRLKHPDITASLARETDAWAKNMLPTSAPDAAARERRHRALEALEPAPRPTRQQPD